MTTNVSTTKGHQNGNYFNDVLCSLDKRVYNHISIVNIKVSEESRFYIYINSYPIYHTVALRRATTLLRFVGPGSRVKLKDTIVCAF